MSAFEKVREMIEKRHNELYEKWKNKNRHSDCDNCDIMCEGYNYENDHKNKRQQFLNEMDRDNYKYMNIDEELLNESYREGSKWILKYMRSDDDDYGLCYEEKFDLLSNVVNDNNIYLKELVYWIQHEM